MSVFDKLHELKDSLVPTEHGDHTVPAGSRKDQDEAREKIHGEAKKEESIQRKEGWSEKVSSCCPSATRPT